MRLDETTISKIAVAITALGVLWNIFYSFWSRTKSNYDSVRPYISLNSFRVDSTYDPFYDGLFGANDGDDGEAYNPQYKEVAYKEFNFVISNNEIKVYLKLDEDKMEKIRYRGRLSKELASGVNAITINNFYYMPLEVNNVGKGAAINLSIGLNDKKKNYTGTCPITLKENESIKISIYTEDLMETLANRYYLVFYYEDIFANKFKQIYNINKNDSSGFVLILESKQKRVNKLIHNLLNNKLISRFK